MAALRAPSSLRAVAVACGYHRVGALSSMAKGEGFLKHESVPLGSVEDAGSCVTEVGGTDATLVGLEMRSPLEWGGHFQREEPMAFARRRG